MERSLMSGPREQRRGCQSGLVRDLAKRREIQRVLEMRMMVVRKLLLLMKRTMMKKRRRKIMRKKSNK